MTIWEQLIEIVAKVDSSLARSRARAAIKTLSSLLGQGLVVCEKDLPLAAIVTVPGDASLWIVFGTWEDGTYDIIREGGMFSHDVMTGWAPGQSRKDYDKALEDEKSEELKEEPPVEGPSRAGSATPRSAPGLAMLG